MDEAIARETKRRAAIDTNILARLLTKDEPKQYATASALIQGGDILVATTVLLETEWVLRSSYESPRIAIGACEGHAKARHRSKRDMRLSPRRNWPSIGSSLVSREPVAWRSNIASTF